MTTDGPGRPGRKRTPGDAAFDMPPRRRRGRARGIVARFPVAGEPGRIEAARGAATHAPAVRRWFARDARHGAGPVPSGSLRLPPADPGGGAWSGTDEPGVVGGRKAPAFPPGGIPTNREEIIMLILHTVPGDEAEAKDTEAGTPGDSPESALAEIGLDRSSICEILSAEPGSRETGW